MIFDAGLITKRAVKACQKCWEVTGHLPRVILLPRAAYEEWRRTFGPMMKIYCLWLVRPPTFLEEAEHPDAGDRVPTCTMHVLEQPTNEDVVSVLNPMRGQWGRNP